MLKRQFFESGKEAFVYDSELPGFALRVQPSGRRVLDVIEMAIRKITIAPINEINEAAARARAIDLRQAKRVGRDLHEEEQARITAQKKAEAVKLLTAGYCFEKFYLITQSVRRQNGSLSISLSSPLAGLRAHARK